MGIYTDAIEFLRESNNIEDVWDDLALANAIYAWEYIFDKKIITQSLVKHVHGILMRDQPLSPEDKGEYRKQPIFVGDREGQKWFVLPELMENWCNDTNEYIKQKTRLTEKTTQEDDVKEFHVRYEKIHPFVDGNGRTGRIFMNWMRHRLYMPLLVIKESEKREYYKWFK